MIRKIIIQILRFFHIEIRIIKKPNYKFLETGGIKTVLDIGANVGEFSQTLDSILPGIRIIAFEPIKSCYDKLVINCENINLTACQFALGDKEEAVRINISKHLPSSSLLQMTDLHKSSFKGTDYSAEEEIVVKRLDDIATDLELKDNILVKIDVQGFEDRVIKGGMNTLSKARYIWIETSYVQLYDSQLLFDGIYKLLNDMGFLFAGNLAQTKKPEDGSILYADSLFEHKRFK